MTATQKSAYTLLREIEARSQQYAFGIPQKVAVKRTWSGIGFRLGEVLLVSHLDAVDEIMKIPQYTRVPSALPWVVGLANVRGILLPIMDLNAYISRQATRKGRTSRILVVRNGDNFTGLLVDEVFGIQHFFNEDYAEQAETSVAELGEYLTGCYRQHGKIWNVFSMDKLNEHDEFVNIAAHGAQK